MSERRQIQHALKYAEALDTIYMLDKYKQYYPHIFDYVDMKTRPATADDYFVPNNAIHCLVIDSLRFVDKRACDHLGCFPFKALGEPCTDTDPPQWSPLGNTQTLSCQKMCQREKHIDTEWWGDRCVRVNPLKKLVVMFPERVWGRKSYHQYHHGLDWRKGQISLNARYCRAYGMEFDGYECIMSLGQTIAEMFVGTTIYRSIKTQGMTQVTVPPPVYVNLVYENDPIQPAHPVESEDAGDWAREIVRDVSADFGVDISLHVVKKFLKKRAPALIVKATMDVGVRHALARAVVRNYGLMLAKGSAHLAKALGVVSLVFTAYSIVSLIVDAVDPNMFNYLLTGKMVDKLNRRLDVQYFQQEENFNREVTPDFVWDYILDLENQSDRILHMAENIKTYLGALQTLPPDVITQPPPGTVDLPLILRQRNEASHWNLTMHFTLLGMLLTLSMLWREWVHVWSLLVLLGLFIM